MKEYICRKHLREPFKVMLGAVMYIIGLFIVFSSISYLSVGKLEKETVFLSYGITLVIIIVVLIIGFIISYYLKLKKYKSLKISIGKDNLIYKSIKGTSIIPYNDIIKLEFPSLKYTKGWIKISCKNEIIKLDVAIENIGLFIKDLKEKLDSIGLSKLYNEKRMFNYYKTASYSDESWERIYELSHLIPPTVAINVIVAFIFSFLVYERPIKLIVAGILFLFPIIVIISTEMILVIKHILELKEENYTIIRRNIEYEHKIYRLILCIDSIILTGILVYFLLKF